MVMPDSVVPEPEEESEQVDASSPGNGVKFQGDIASNINVTYQEEEEFFSGVSEDEDPYFVDQERWRDEDERDRKIKALLPDEEGIYHDDPLWHGKTLEQIRYATELEKSNGNAASRDGDWKRANRYWKNALKGAEKLEDHDTEFRLRLNLALGYIRRQKPDRALEHCDELFRERLKSQAEPSQIAKAHFRRGEALVACGEEAKAARSFQTVLDVEPANADARRRLLELRRLEQERRQREKTLFADKLPAAMLSAAAEAPVAETSVEDREVAKEDDGGEEGEEEEWDEEEEEEEEDEAADGPEALRRAQAALSTDHLTDRQASARLLQSLGSMNGEGLNYFVGAPTAFNMPSRSTG